MIPRTDVLLNFSSLNQINVEPEEVRRKLNNMLSILSKDSLTDFKLLDDITTTSILEKMGEKLVEIYNSTQALEGIVNRPVHHNIICFDDRRTTFYSQEDDRIEMPGSMVNENWWRFQQIHSSEAIIYVIGEESLFKVVYLSSVYPNVIRNEYFIMMRSFYMFQSKAKYLFGLERSQNLFDLRATGFRHFGSTGPIYEVVPNMTESAIRQKDISFFEHACDMMNRPISLLLRYKDISTNIRLYTNVIRNETYRMISSIDMVMSEAKHLFGLERSKIFFDLLSADFCHFGSTGAIDEFVPNMAVSTIRQKVISFFEHACDMMNRLISLLLRCPDSKRLQQMSVQNFISLMKPVIKSSLKTKTKGKEKLSLEENIITMADQKEFEISLGEEIREDILNRPISGDKMVVQWFVDTRLERPQPSDRQENRPIHHSIYFPLDCRLFIYIPTEIGSYWYRLDMRRADRIRGNSR